MRWIILIVVFCAYILPVSAVQGQEVKAWYGEMEEGRSTWYNPVNGRKITMPQNWSYLVIEPGLSWDFYQEGVKKFNFSFRERVLGRISFVRVVSDYEEISHDFKLCGQRAKRTLTYHKSDAAQRRVSLRFYTDSLARTPHSPSLFKYALDLDFSFSEDALESNDVGQLFCPFVDNFQHIADEMMLEEGNMWHNPLSEEMLQLPFGWHAHYVDITVTMNGRMQIYHMCHDDYHIMLYKLPYEDFVPDKEREFLDKRDLPQGTLFQRDNFHEGSVKGEFIIPNAGEKEIRGILLDKKWGENQIYVKIWNSEGFEIDEREKELATRLIENSLPH